jgi:hypothetical protein
MNELFLGVLTHLAAAGIGGTIIYVLRKHWSAIQNWRNEEVNRIAELIEGKWRATEVFSDDRSKAIFTMELRCSGTEVNGELVGIEGKYDRDAVFDLSGSFKDRVLTFVWKKRKSLESGTVTVKLPRDRELEGAGLYIAPSDDKVYTSVFTAKKQGQRP